MFISGRFFTKYREKKCILNNIFRKFEIVVCFAPLLCGVQRNTILNFDWISKIPKAWNLKFHIARRKRWEKGEVGLVVLACKSDEEEREAARATAFPYALITDRRCFCICDCVGIRSMHTELIKAREVMQPGTRHDIAKKKIDYIILHAIFRISKISRIKSPHLWRKRLFNII